MTTLSDVLIAFEHNTEQLDGLLTDLSADDWARPTPAPGWSVRDQVAHLAFVFDLARRACSDPASFGAATSAAQELGFETVVNNALAQWGEGTPAQVLARWRTTVTEVGEALREVQTPTVPWLVSPLPPVVLTMAGMMETFAHGQDVADAVGQQPARSDSLAYLVHFIARTRDFGYLGRGLEPPEQEFRFEVVLPSGRPLHLGPEGSPDVVRGPALDLCLLAARRRHVDDLALTATGAAREWLPIAQAYRGPGGVGREPGQFATSSAA